MEIKVYKIATKEPGAHMIERTLDGAVATLEAFLADAAIGSGYTVEVVTMAEAEVDELPEFAGW